MLYEYSFTASPEKVKDSELSLIAAKKAGIKAENISSFRVLKRSIDARKSPVWQYRVCFSCPKKDALNAGLSEYREKSADYILFSSVKPKKRPVVAGFGPAGIFCALTLARAGARPIVVEKGADADTRKNKVDLFFAGGELDEQTNIQFGEGGAGTFSDGKLNTGIKEKNLRGQAVIRTFHEHGAPEEILFDAKPHVGTDLLIGCIKSIRREIISLGGEVRFLSPLTHICTERGVITSITAGGDQIETDTLFVATGHSSREIYDFAADLGLAMEHKAFSVGLRIEHRQSDVSESLYKDKVMLLPPAEYRVSAATHTGRSLYSFCMCPGGVVVPAASERERMVTNGMSYHDRAGENANSALLVGVLPTDLAGDDYRAGFWFRDALEARAFALGGGNHTAPVQIVGNFLKGENSSVIGRVLPSYSRGAMTADLTGLFPKVITETMKDGIKQLGERYSFFRDMEAVLTGVESRTTSPLRIKRGGDMQAMSGLYPIGEGAGYAGGIVSAAVDGIKAAELYIGSLTE